MYGIVLQFRLDIRNKNLLLTCYVVPTIFMLIMGQIFSVVNPDYKSTLATTMVIMGVSMGSLIGTSATILETYNKDVKKMYLANNISIRFGILATIVSSFVHLMIMSFIAVCTIYILFDATINTSIGMFTLNLIVFILSSLSIAVVMGISAKSSSKLTMISRLVFLPSMMLSGIMFDSALLPSTLNNVAKLLPATWANIALSSTEFNLKANLIQVVIMLLSVIVSMIIIKNEKFD